ncbi:MAG: hypothetical protein MI861_22560, partial [Pirellulales bacterium]|nr:hypothetical protein [Pirellulales bacterium]
MTYANSFDGVFLFDDFGSIVNNPDIHSLEPAAIRTTFGVTRQVVALTVAANYYFGGLGPFGYHCVNLAIHTLAALTLFGLIWRLLRAGGSGGLAESDPAESDPDGQKTKAAIRIAFSAAVLFAVHPLQTSAVTYVIQRFESMTSLFYLLMLYALTRSASAGRTVSRFAWSLASVVAFTLALFSKEVAITGIFVALLVD